MGFCVCVCDGRAVRALAPHVAAAATAVVLLLLHTDAHIVDAAPLLVRAQSQAHALLSLPWINHCVCVCVCLSVDVGGLVAQASWEAAAQAVRVPTERVHARSVWLVRPHGMRGAEREAMISASAYAVARVTEALADVLGPAPHAGAIAMPAIHLASSDGPQKGALILSDRQTRVPPWASLSLSLYLPLSPLHCPSYPRS
jgi:hypothetical protein